MQIHSKVDHMLEVSLEGCACYIWLSCMHSSRDNVITTHTAQELPPGTNEAASVRLCMRDVTPVLHTQPNNLYCQDVMSDFDLHERG